jgi:hypothetical protein
MNRLLTRTAVAAATLAALVAAHLAISPNQAFAGDKHAWGFSTLGDTCSGTCGAGNICCKIVIISPDA